MPWRLTSDPYAIWVSEVMLQQTQVKTVIPYWLRWMEQFPTIESLAVADEQAVLAVWQGLGYYQRCRRLVAGAKWVVEHGLPTNVAGWLQVPGIGPYTAGAIASIAQGVVAPVVDGNVERVVSRLTLDDSESTQRTKRSWKWAEAHLDRERPGDWNQALMELGATVCLPRNPLCPTCPISFACEALATDRVSEFPAVNPKPTVVELKHVVWIPYFHGRFGVRQIALGQWWAGMWEFPRTDLDSESGLAELRAILGAGQPTALPPFRHAVTHHRIRIYPELVHCQMEISTLRWATPDELKALPMPAPQRKALGLALKLLAIEA